MPSHPPKRQPRLKESCDRCSIAKVRCNKDKPSCSRCAAKGLSCGYSFSRRAGRRTTTNLPRSCTSSPHMSTPSLASISPNLGASPSVVSDDSSDVFPDAWSFTPAQQPIPMPQQQFGWDQELYAMPAPTFEQGQFNFSTPPIAHDPSLMAPMDMSANLDFYTPSIPMDSMNTPPLSIASNTPPLPLARTPSAEQSDAVQDELLNLTSFAETMEKKFDAVVRQRMQYRDVYSEFGVPVDEMDLSNPATVMRMREQGEVVDPDLSELSMYYSLAELKRRLKWLSEDVGNLVVQP